MSIDTAKKILTKHLSDENNFDELLIEFHGGEPFLEFDLIQEICEYTWNKSWPKPYLFFSTTNGTLVHGKIKSWLKTNKDKIYLSLSLDGTKEMHDLNRTKSFSKIDIQFFKESWPNQPVKMTISKETLPNLSEGVIYLHSIGLNIENNLAFGVDWSDQCNIDILCRELKLLSDFYLNNPDIIPCELFSVDIKQVALAKQEKNKWCGVGTSIVAIDTNGEEYPCHYFLPMSIGDNKAKLSKNIDFTNSCNFHDPKCDDCILLPVCPTCYGVNYYEHNDTAIRNNDLCNLTKIRVLACSYLESQNLLRNKNRLKNISETEKLEMSLLLDSIKLIQNKITLTN